MDDKDRLIDELLKNGRKLSADHKDLKDELAFRRNVANALGAARRASIKEELQQLENSIEQKKKPVVLRSWRFYAAAAVLLGLVASTVWWSLSNTTTNDDLLVYLKPYPNVVTAPYVRGGEQEENEDALKKAMHAYERGEYANSIALLEALPPSDTSLFYTAVASLQLPNQGGIAADIFTRLSEDNSSPFYWQGMYYLAVMELMDKKSVPARKRLEQLKKQNAYPYLSRRAADLLLKRY